MLATAVLELVQQFYHATEISNVANGVSACVDAAIADKSKTIVSDKVISELSRNIILNKCSGRKVCKEW